MIRYAGKLPAGAVGSGSAQVMGSSVLKDDPLGIEKLMNILHETRRRMVAKLATTPIK